MAWSPTYKKNRFEALKGLKIKDRADYNRIRKYFATLNGHVYGETDLPEKSQVRNSLFAGQRFKFMSLAKDQSVSTPSTDSDTSALAKQRWKKVQQASNASVMSTTSN